MIRKTKFRAVKSTRYFLVNPLLCLPNSRKVMRLASEAISVPVPPMLTPTRSSGQFSVKRESRIAEGTLLITWQERVETRSVFFSISRDTKRFTASMRDILPEKMKKQKNVKSSG